MTTNRVLYLLGPERVELREEPLPDPAGGEILIRIDAAATCGTDLKVYLRGSHPRMLTTPSPFGHEMTGTVVAGGGHGSRWSEGDQVVVVNSASCGECAFCRAGRENLCENLIYLNGAFAEHLLVPEAFVRRSTYARPRGLDPALAALTEPLGCMFHGLSVLDGTDPAECVVVGAGPIGLFFVSELAHRGHDVVLGDLVPHRLAVGEKLGAARTVLLDGNGEDGARLAAATAHGRGAPLVVDATGNPDAWCNMIKAAATGGQVVLFGGYPPGTTAALDTHWLHYHEITVRGVYHHRPTAIRAALERLSGGETRLDLLLEARCSLDGIEGALQRMAAREILKASVIP